MPAGSGLTKVRMTVHSQPVPSRAAVTRSLAQAVAAGYVVAWIGNAMETGREYAGFVLGLIVLSMCVSQAIDRAVDRTRLTGQRWYRRDLPGTPPGRYYVMRSGDRP